MLVDGLVLEALLPFPAELLVRVGDQFEVVAVVVRVIRFSILPRRRRLELGIVLLLAPEILTTIALLVVGLILRAARVVFGVPVVVVVSTFSILVPLLVRVLLLRSVLVSLSSAFAVVARRVLLPGLLPSLPAVLFEWLVRPLVATLARVSRVDHL